MIPYFARDGISLYLGDAREVVATLAATSVDLVLTDPPYGHNNNADDLIARRELVTGPLKAMLADKDRWKWITGAMSREEYAAAATAPRPILSDDAESSEILVQWLFAESRRVLAPGGCCCCCCAGGGGPAPQFARWSLWLDEAIGFKQMVIWDKGGLGMGWHYRRNYEVILVGEKPGAACKWYGGLTTSNVIRINKIIPQKSDHPTPKPVELMMRFIELHSVPGDLVLDPFAGGGSTLLAALRLERRAIGVEIDERWANMAAERLSQGVLPFHESKSEDEPKEGTLF